MDAHSYTVTDPVAGFDEGDILDVTARFGDWQQFTMKLERTRSTADSTTVVVTGERGGFTEAEILDPTARFGDWHEFDLQFDPQGEKRVSSTRVELTHDEFERATEPLTATA